ncbi:MAG: LPXTG cell wall anchor domain-containing protein [Erysipelotrichaceae bacterium]|nr:LPXTG cell wall anchor domain-containing protein [Erysipelotrichaceae bacterium]
MIVQETEVIVLLWNKFLLYDGAPSPSGPDFQPWVVLMVGAVVVIIAAVLFFLLKRKK